MQATKKLILVDEFDPEYKRMQRPTVAVAKTDHSLRLSDTVRDGSLSDDCKVREYVGALHRYLNVGNRTHDPEVTPKINWITEPTKRKKKPVKRGTGLRQWDQY